VTEPTNASQPDRLSKVRTAEGEREIDIYSPEGFDVLANLWTRIQTGNGSCPTRSPGSGFRSFSYQKTS